MALSATMRRFAISLADSDRDRYEQLDLRVAQHPSESERYLVARVIARVLEHADGVDFSRGGLSVDDEPALMQRDLRGDLQAWIEVGSPSADRLHKASKAAPRVAVYTWKRTDELVDAIRERKVHRADQLELYAIEPELLDSVAARLDRNNTWDLAITGGSLYLTIGEALCEGTLRRIPVG
jgi:uncharacterized protein YaeQ